METWSCARRARPLIGKGAQRNNFDLLCVEAAVQPLGDIVLWIGRGGVCRALAFYSLRFG